MRSDNGPCLVIGCTVEGHAALLLGNAALPVYVCLGHRYVNGHDGTYVFEPDMEPQRQAT